MALCKTRNIRPAIAATILVAAATACENDNNPYGPAYRTVHHTIVGAYRPLEELFEPVPELPDGFEPTPAGVQVRIVFGSLQTLYARLILPADQTGRTRDVRMYGVWEYDVNARRITMRVDPTTATEAFETVLQVTLLDDWVRLQGVVEIGGQMVPLDLGKSLLDPATGGGGGGGPANRVSAR